MTLIGIGQLATELYAMYKILQFTIGAHKNTQFCNLN